MSATPKSVLEHSSATNTATNTIASSVSTTRQHQSTCISLLLSATPKSILEHFLATLTATNTDWNTFWQHSQQQTPTGTLSGNTLSNKHHCYIIVNNTTASHYMYQSPAVSNTKMCTRTLFGNTRSNKHHGSCQSPDVNNNDSNTTTIS